MEKGKTFICAAIAIAILVTTMSMGCIEEQEELSFEESLANLETQKNELDKEYDELLAQLETNKNEIDKAYNKLIEGLNETKKELGACGVDIEEIKGTKQANNIRSEWEFAAVQIKRNFDVAKGEIEAVATGCREETDTVVEEAEKQISKNLDKLEEEYCN